MIPFQPTRGAFFRCRIEPSWRPYANINFFAADRESIPFHLSLRLAENRIVLNRRVGKAWGREKSLPFTFPGDPFTMDCHFSRGGIAVSVAGQSVGTFSALPRFDRTAQFLLRRGFPDLDSVRSVTIDGAVAADSVAVRDGQFERLWSAITPSSGVVLTDRMELAERVPDSAKGARHAICLPGEDEAIPLEPSRRRDESAPNIFALPQGMAAVVIPGRIWHGLPEGQDAIVTLRDLRTGQDRPFPISRTDLAARIARLAADSAIDDDDLAAVQAIEHVHYARIWPLLDRRTAGAVMAAAKRLGLSAFLVPPAGLSLSATAAPVPPGTAAAEASVLAVGRIAAALSAHLEPGADRGQLADRLATAWAHEPKANAEDLALGLVAGFCECDAVDILHAATSARSPLPQRDWRDPYYLSATLPFRLLDGQTGRVLDNLRALVHAPAGWLVTPALGWVARRLCHRSATVLPEAQRHALLTAFLDLLRHQAEDPWGRAPCLHLIDATVDILCRAETFPDDLRYRAISTAIRAYALSPRFWHGLSDHLSPDRMAKLSPDLHRAALAFARMASVQPFGPEPASEGSDRALDQLAALHPAGLSTALFLSRAPDRVAQGPNRPADAELRALFHPAGGAADVLVPGAVVERAITTDRAPHASAARRLGQMAFATLAEATGLPAETRATRLAQTLDAAEELASSRANGLGFAVALALLRGLGDDAAATARILDWIASARAALVAPDDDVLSTSPAVQMALSGLPHPLAEAASAALRLAPPPAARAPHSPPNDPASALFDTLVVVFSCRPNLATRIPAMRRGWLADLAALGIPHIVVVGGTGPVDDDDVVVLDAPDDYEGLPQKTLAMLDHVRRTAPQRRILKIDDDCFLDVREYFESLAFLDAHYYGRPLQRVRGQLDRAWHMAKSSSLRGRLELDKSPEPSLYADGGSGYLLTRPAIDAALSAARTAEGQRLIRTSFMEDKMLGDLLAMQGIRVSGRDYRIHVLRRSRKGGLLVPKWENTCLPFAGSGIKLAHLDGHDLQEEAARHARAIRPTGTKIWPTTQIARLGAQSNALDLVSPRAHLDAAAEAAVSVVACMRNEMAFLPHFLSHYRALGVASFLVADNGSDDGTLEYLAEQPDVALFSVDTEYRHSFYGVAWQEAMMAAFRPGRWSLVADADELLTLDTTGGGDLAHLLGGPEFDGADAARLFMLDLYPGGPLPELDFDTAPPFEAAPFCDRVPFLETSLGRGPFSDAPTWTSATRHRLIPGSRAELFVAQKIALLRYAPWMRLSAGLHYVAETRLAPRALLFGHFKYTAAFRAKAAAEVARGQHFNDAEEYRKYLDLAAEGRDVIHDPAVSVRWTECDFVRSVLTTGRPLRRGQPL